MKKFLFISLTVIILAFAGYYAFIYYVPFSEGFRAGELVKFSKKGVGFKTWEGQISQGVSEAQVFYFSVQDNEEEVIEQLKQLQGKNVKLTYTERYKTFPWLGETKYFVTEVEKTIYRENQNVSEDVSEKENNNLELEMLKKENKMLKVRIKDLETTINILKNTSNN